MLRQTQVSNLSATLQVVEIALRSLQDTPLDDHGQDALRLVDSLHKDAAETLGDLDALVDATSARRTSDRVDGVAPALEPLPKVARFRWLRKNKQIEGLRMRLRAVNRSLSTALTALNTIQIASS